MLRAREPVGSPHWALALRTGECEHAHEITGELSSRDLVEHEGIGIAVTTETDIVEQQEPVTAVAVPKAKRHLVELPEPLSVDALLTRLEIDARRVAVELNEVVVKKAAYPATIVRPGDAVEVVVVRCEGSGSTDLEDSIWIVLGSEEGEDVAALLVMIAGE